TLSALLHRAVPLGSGRREYRGEDPLVRPARRLPCGQRAGPARSAPPGPGRHPGSWPPLHLVRHLLRSARPGFSRPASAVHRADGGPVHRLAVLLPRRPGEYLPLLLPVVADLLCDPLLVAGHLRDLGSARHQLRPALPRLAPGRAPALYPRPDPG